MVAFVGKTFIFAKKRSLGRRNKLERREEYHSLPNTFNMDMGRAGRWGEFFGNPNPVWLELGAGKADLSYGLAQMHAERNYVAVDIKSVRMWVGARRALEQGLSNIAFLRADIHRIELYFAENEVEGIWITFPDPFPRKKHTKNRLTWYNFLLQYYKILKPGGRIYFKTDNDPLFEFTLDHFSEINASGAIRIILHEQTRDLHNSPLKNEENGITTDYERRFLELGKKTNYLCFSLEKGDSAHPESVKFEEKAIETLPPAPYHAR